MHLPDSASELTASRHLPLEVLRRYVAGTLEPAEQHGVEAHTLNCPRCADLLEGLALQPAAVTDASMVDLRQRLNARVHELATESKPKPALGWAWQQLAAAAVLLLTLGAAVMWFALLRPAPLNTTSRPAAAQREALATAPIAPSAPMLVTPESAATAVTIPEVAAVTPEPAASDLAAVTPATPLRQSRVLARRPARAARQVTTDGPVLIEPTEFASGALEPLNGEVAVSTIASSDSVRQARKVSGGIKEAAAETEAKAKVAHVAAAAAAPSSPDLRTVQGRVTDAAGVPLPGATVLVPGTQNGTSTNAKGAFSLQVPATTKQLSVSSIGYTAQTRSLRPTDSTLALALAPDTKALSEVVVVRRDAPPAPMSVGAMPAGGYAGLKKYLRDSLDYPEKALEARQEGNVKLRFVVGVDGKLSDINVVKKLSEECDAEAIRLLQEGPAWFPAIQNGRRTARTVEITVPFKIEQR